ncbi:hypothetical protein LINGRAHAP2_LOCUS16264 [Linum grandiflorum]
MRDFDFWLLLPPGGLTFGLVCQDLSSNPDSSRRKDQNNKHIQSKNRRKL